MTDDDFMLRALELARQGEGRVEPNPMVGAVVVREGRIVGEGFHARYGEAHAEVHALREAGDAARDADLFVTLEPCCHHGKTPPCCSAILRAGIRRVVASMLDPFPAVAGKGIDVLRGAGVGVEIGVGGPAARDLNAPYLKRLRTGMPWVIAKWAMTLDGKIATTRKHSQWISSPGARAKVHTLRSRVDAIIVGGGTVNSDDPLLTARPPGPRIAARVVVTGRGNMQESCQLTRTAGDAPVLVFCTQQASARLRSWQDAGCEIITISGERVIPIGEILAELGKRQMTNILVEGGSTLLGSFFDAGAIDEVHAFIAPKLIGGEGALSPIGGKGVETMEDAVRIEQWQVEELDGNIYARGRRGH